MIIFELWGNCTLSGTICICNCYFDKKSNVVSWQTELEFSYDSKPYLLSIRTENEVHVSK